METAAKAIYDSLNDESDIEKLSQETNTEFLHLDFKSISPSTLSRFEEFRGTLAKWVSGFSNSDGGVVILGVEENKKENKFLLQPSDLYGPNRLHR